VEIQSLPDLQVSLNAILGSMYIGTASASDDCDVAEGCFTGLGSREVLRFTTTISNYGTDDFFIGNESLENPNFYFDSCHNHYHFEGYANYQLFDTDGIELSFGHKNGWCVMDLGSAVSTEAPEGWQNNDCSFQYGCSTMGISAGCSDTYSSGLACQWIDTTELAAGTYILEVSTNLENEYYPNPIPESNFDNNYVFVEFTIDSNRVLSDVQEYKGNAGTLGARCIDYVGGEANVGKYFYNTNLNDPSSLFPAVMNRDYQTILPLILPSGNFRLSDFNLPQGLNVGCYDPFINDSCLFSNDVENNECLVISGVLTNPSYEDQTLELTFDITNKSTGHISSETFNLSVEEERPGCTIPAAFNYDPNANYNDGSCINVIEGCVDPFALNYNPNANVNDGSCNACAEGVEYVLRITLFDSYGDGWNGNTFSLTDGNGNEVSGNTQGIHDKPTSASARITMPQGSEIVYAYCLPAGCYNFETFETGGWAYESTWQIESLGLGIDLTGGVPAESIEFVIESPDAAPGTIPECGNNSNTCETYNIGNNWSSWSTYLTSDDMSVQGLFGDQLDDIIIIKNYAGQAYIEGFNGFGDVEVGQGYQIKSTSEIEITVCGKHTYPSFTNLTNGWNLIGVNGPGDYSISEVFDNVIANIFIVKDFAGNAFLPEFNFDPIGTLINGQGYQVKTTAAVTIQF
jgi:hypothetical protein